MGMKKCALCPRLTRTKYCGACRSLARKLRQSVYDEARPNRPRSGKCIPRVPCKAGCGALVVGGGNAKGSKRGPVYCVLCRAARRATIARQTVEHTSTANP